MDATPLYPIPYHPAAKERTRDFSDRGWYYPSHYTRTQRPVKYYFTDFGISRRYNPDDGPPLEDPIYGGDKTAPEFQVSLDACNPFPTDVYYLGNAIRETFLGVRFILRLRKLAVSQCFFLGCRLPSGKTWIRIHRASGGRNGAGRPNKTTKYGRSRR